MAERPASLTVLHECGVGERPCPRVECRHHLACGEKPAKFAARADASESCSLDVAVRGPLGLQEIGRLLGVNRQRVEQLEKQALRAAKRARAFAHQTTTGEAEGLFTESTGQRRRVSVANRWD